VAQNKEVLLVWLRAFCPPLFRAKKKPRTRYYREEAFQIKDRQRLTLPGVILVPSALAGLTALFGMGRGDPRRYSHLKVLAVGRWLFGHWQCSFDELTGLPIAKG
jgi:hypothetical protein